eukprot:COSAG05_NODE_4543_length_1470_cov_39.315098_1_plen_88_part_00
MIFGARTPTTPPKRESPEISLVADFRVPANPYNAGPWIRDHGVNNSHLALHIGAVQFREALLLTSALDANDALQYYLCSSLSLSRSL